MRVLAIAMYRFVSSCFVKSNGRSTRIRTQIDGFGDRCSTIELYSYGAENEIRTRDPHLGKVMLYH